MFNFIQVSAFLYSSSAYSLSPFKDASKITFIPDKYKAQIRKGGFERHAEPKTLSPREVEDSIAPLLQLCSAHFISQALHCVIQLGVPNILGNEMKTIDEIISEINQDENYNCNSDALFRCMRILSAKGIFHEKLTEDQCIVFGLSMTGALLQTNVKNQPSMASCVQHWMEHPLWDAWLELPNYVAGIVHETNNSPRQSQGDDCDNHYHNELPFDRANRISSDEFYANDSQSLKYANDFVRFIHDREILSVVHGFDWTRLEGKTIVDLGGHNGKLLGAIAKEHPLINYKCLDLPEVISSVPPSSIPPGVDLVPGDMLDASTIPSCDAIIMKHILDRSMWNEQESIQILKSCHDAVPSDGIVIIAEAVLPDIGKVNIENQMPLFMDAFYVLVGRGGQRTQMEWSQLVAEAGLQIESFKFTSSPTCSIVVLSKRTQE